MTASIDPQAIPGYTLQRVLGRGGMATVYLAHQASVDREVALKLMSTHLLTDPRFTERFLREARIAAKLQHRHVVSIYDVGVYAEQPFIAMEHLPGGPIMAHEGDPISEEAALRCVQEIGMALDYAHGKGFIHRDVKPDNILLREDGGSVLSDFGIARTVDSATMMTKTGAVVGTPFYMSPEQLRGKEVDGRADLYSLGVVFYQLLTGKVPYTASDSLAIGIMHMTAPLPSLPKPLKHLQPLLDYMLAKDISSRVQTGRDLADLASAQLKKGSQHSVRTEPQVSVGALERPETRRIESLKPRIEPQLNIQGDRHPLDAATNGSRSAGNQKLEPSSAGQWQAHDSVRGKIEPSMGSAKSVMRAEPQIGRIDPAMDRAAWRAPARADQPRDRRPWLWLMLGLVLSAVGVWQKDKLVEAWQAQFGVQDPQQAEAEAAERAGKIVDDSGQDALTLYGLWANAAPDNAEAQQALQRIIQLALTEAQAISGKDPNRAAQIAEKVLLIDSEQPAASALLRKLRSSGQPVVTSIANTNSSSSSEARLEAALETALAAERKKQWLGRNGALAGYLAAQALSPTNVRAKNGVRTAELEASKLLDTAIRNDAGETVNRLSAEWEVAQVNSPAREQLMRTWLAKQIDAGEQQVQIAQWLEAGNLALRAGQLTSPRGESAADRFLAVLALQPNNAAAKSGLASVQALLLTQAANAIEADQLEKAQRLLLQAKEKGADAAEVQKLQDRIVLVKDRIETVEVEVDPARKAQQRELIEKIDVAVSAGKVSTPPGDSALDLYKQAQRLGPSPDLEMAEQKVRVALQSGLSSDIENGEFENAFNAMSGLRALGPDPALKALSQRLEESLVGDIRTKIASENFEAAERRIQLLGRLAVKHPELEALKLEFLNAKGVD